VRVELGRGALQQAKVMILGSVYPRGRSYEGERRHGSAAAVLDRYGDRRNVNTVLSVARREPSVANAGQGSPPLDDR
jgi:hypothetical protein